MKYIYKLLFNWQFLVKITAVHKSDWLHLNDKRNRLDKNEISCDKIIATSVNFILLERQQPPQQQKLRLSKK